jgi:ribosomal-protein-serine acetyltransferase
VFSHKLTEDTELRLLEERHAEELTNLIDRNREHLRAWLPWVDTTRTVEDLKNFIRGALKQFAQNKGFVAGIWHAFGELGLNRVVISCATENEKSCAIPERLGFRREGIERQAEWLYYRFVDHVTYSALASEWPRRHS